METSPLLGEASAGKLAWSQLLLTGMDSDSGIHPGSSPDVRTWPWLGTDSLPDGRVSLESESGETSNTVCVDLYLQLKPGTATRN